MTYIVSSGALNSTHSLTTNDTELVLWCSSVIIWTWNYVFYERPEIYYKAFSETIQQ